MTSELKSSGATEGSLLKVNFSFLTCTPLWGNPLLECKYCSTVSALTLPRMQLLSNAWRPRDLMEFFKAKISWIELHHRSRGEMRWKAQVHHEQPQFLLNFTPLFKDWKFLSQQNEQTILRERTPCFCSFLGCPHTYSDLHVLQCLL